MVPQKLVCCLALLFMVGASAHGEEAEPLEKNVSATDEQKRESPWLIVPLVSSNPKLGTSGGAMAGYMYHFDDKSPVSIFGVGGLYTTTNSKVGSVFARTFFGEGRQRLNVFAASGEINNDYSNFNNTGFTVKSQGNIRGVFARYLYGVSEHWYVGVQMAVTNYTIIAQDVLSEIVLDLSGLKGLDSNGAGLVVNYDSRNNVNTPVSGIYALANNIAFRKGLGGTVNFDVYAFTLKQYLPHGDRFVLGWKLSNQWTKDAPPSGYASVSLRGYTRGQYIAPDMSSLEIEERIGIGESWGMTAFAGVACLYGDDMQCSDSDSENIYPEGGGGIYYMLKPQDKIAVTMEYAIGKEDNQGFYLKMGWGF